MKITKEERDLCKALVKTMDKLDEKYGSIWNFCDCKKWTFTDFTKEQIENDIDYIIYKAIEKQLDAIA